MVQPSVDANGQKTAALVAGELRRRIATGALRPGDRLPPEDGLMEEFSLARTTLREALRILEFEGIITVIRGRRGGPLVTSPLVEHLARSLALHLQLGGATLGDLHDARQLIEPHLAGTLASVHTDEDLTALEDAIAAAATAAKAEDNEAFGLAATTVYETLVQRAGNKTLSLVALMLHEVVSQYYRSASSETTAEMRQRAIRSYRRLRRYIEDGDATGAAEHWRKHLAFTIEQIDRNRPLEVFHGKSRS